MTPLRRRSLRLLLALAVLGVSVLAASADAAGAPPAPAPSAPASGGIGIGLVDAPLDRADDPRARNFVVDHVDPGAVLQRRIRVVNGTDEARTVALYAAAADIVDGAWTPQDGRAANDLSGWIRVEPATVDVPAGAVVHAVVRIAVPGDTPPGERYAVVWAEPPPATSGGLTVVHRAGVRVYLSVGGDEPATDFAVAGLTAGHDAAGPHLLVEVANTGGRAVDLRTSALLADPDAPITAGPFGAATPATIGPGATATLRIDLPAGLDEGPWRAEVTVSDDVRERRRSFSITIPDVPVTDAVDASAPGGAPVIVPPAPAGSGGHPLAGALAAALVVLLLGALAWVKGSSPVPGVRGKIAG